jgi:hypothetical protein
VYWFEQAIRYVAGELKCRCRCNSYKLIPLNSVVVSDAGPFVLMQPAEEESVVSGVSRLSMNDELSSQRQPKQPLKLPSRPARPVPGSSEGRGR